MSEPSRSKAGGGLILAACAAVLVWCQGCALTPMERARTIVAASAQGVVAVDGIVAGAYEAVSANGGELERARWNRVITSILVARSTILTAELALDAIDAGGDGSVGSVVACIVGALDSLIDLLPEVGVDVPHAVTIVLSMASAFADGVCDPHAGETTAGLPHASEVMP